MPDVVFYYDLGSPYAYLAADRVDLLFDVDTEVKWEPVLLGGIFKSTGRSSWAETTQRDDGIAEIAARAAARGLPAFVYPDPWPNNGLTAMRAAVRAHQMGAGRRFAMEAFAVQFNDGLPLSDPENIELAAHRAGLDPLDLLDATDVPEIKQKLIDNTQAAIDAGVIGVPSVVVNGEVFWGDDRLHDAAAAANA